MPIFIAKFLINRKFSVRIGGTLSEIYDQEKGVSQGSILAVTLLSPAAPEARDGRYSNTPRPSIHPSVRHV